MALQREHLIRVKSEDFVEQYIEYEDLNAQGRNPLIVTNSPECIAGNFPRIFCSANLNCLSSGVLFLIPVLLSDQLIISRILVCSGNNAGSGISYCNVGIYDFTKSKIGEAIPILTNWESFTIREFILSTVLKIQITQRYFVGILCNASVVPNLLGMQPKFGSNFGLFGSGLSFLPDVFDTITFTPKLPWVECKG